jgi:hypothetical protein
MQKAEGTLKGEWLITEGRSRELCYEIIQAGASIKQPCFTVMTWNVKSSYWMAMGLLLANREKKFKTGDVLFISINEKHQTKNKGKEPVKFLCLYFTRKNDDNS